MKHPLSQILSCVQIVSAKTGFLLLLLSPLLLPTVSSRAANEPSGKILTQEVMKLLATGNQKAAEARLADILRQ